MNNQMYLIVSIFMILFLERLVYTAGLKEPDGKVLDVVLAKGAMGIYILICFIALGESVFVVDRKVLFVVIGVVISGLGVFLRRSSIKALGSNWSCYIRDIKNQSIIADGPYKYFKHPYYIAVCLELLGVIIFCQARLALAVLLIVQVPLLLLRMRVEDRFHVRKFGDKRRNNA